MNSETHENALLVERLRKLEKQIWWIKRIGIASAAVLALLIIILRLVGYREMSAEAFVLRDSNGRARAKLAFFPQGPGLEIYAASGEPRVQLIGGGEDATLNLYIPVTTVRGKAAVNFFDENTALSSLQVGPAAAFLRMRSAANSGSATLSLQRGTASLALSGGGKNAPEVALDTDASRACAAVSGPAPPTAKGSLCVHSPGEPTIKLTDLSGNRSILGVAQTTNRRTGQPRESSAASLVLQPKKGKSLHLAPR